MSLCFALLLLYMFTVAIYLDISVNTHCRSLINVIPLHISRLADVVGKLG